MVDDDEQLQTVENQIDPYEIVQVDALAGAESLKSGQHVAIRSFESNRTRANDQCDFVQAQNASIDYFKVDTLSHATSGTNTHSGQNPSDSVQALFINQQIPAQAMNNLVKIDEKNIQCEQTIKTDDEKAKQSACTVQTETENLQQLNELFDELIQLSRELENNGNHEAHEDSGAKFSQDFLQLDSNMDYFSNDYNEWINDYSKLKETVSLQSPHLEDRQQEQQQHLNILRNENFNNMLQKFESELNTNVLVNNFNDPMMMMIVPTDLSI
jgi:hypothetical protein